MRIWTLTEYDRVVFLDSDQAIIRNFDRVFGCTYDFAFTSGPSSPLNGGTSMCIYTYMRVYI